MKRFLFLATFAALLAGCAQYSWKSAVPAEMRLVAVPVFRNATDLTEAGPVVTRQVKREFQREGTFRLAESGAALEVQGELVSAGAADVNGDLRTGRRLHGGELVLVAKVSVIDKLRGRVLIDGRRFTGSAPFSAVDDNTTAMRDACGRAADDLARGLVDAVLALDFKTEK